MIPVPSSSEKPLKPILKRSASSVRKAVTFSATNSQVFFADDWDRSAVEVVSKLSYSDVLELKQLSLDSLPSDRHASMGLSPLLSHVPLTLCPLACEGTKISASPKSESHAPPSPSVSSPLVIPDLSILASPASVNETLRGSPPPLSPPSSEAASSPPVSLGTISPHSSASSPESSPPKPSVKLTAPVPVRRTLMMNFMPLLPEPGSELSSPVLSAASLSEGSSDTEETTSTLAPQTPVTPHTPHTPTSLSPIPASPTSPTSFSFAPQQTQGPPTGRTNKTRASRAEIAQFSALSGSAAGDLGAVGLQTPRKSADGKLSPVSPISPASDSVSVTSSTLVRPVPRRAFTAPTAKDPEPLAVTKSLVRRESFGSVKGDDEPVARTKTSRSFDQERVTRLAIASAAWADGVPVQEESALIVRPSSVQSFRQAPSSTPAPAPVPAPARPTARSQHRSHSFSDTQPGSQPQPQSSKYVNPYAQIREHDEPRPVPTIEEPRQFTRRTNSDKLPQRTRAPVSGNAKSSSSMPTVPQYEEDVLGLGLVGPRPPPSMTRPNPVHRASVHGYPYGSGRPPSPTPQTFSRPYPSPLTSNVPLPGTQTRPGKPLASKDANIRSTGVTTGSSYTLGPESGLGVSSSDRKPRSANDKLSSDPVMPPLCAPLARPKNSKISR